MHRRYRSSDPIQAAGVAAVAFIGGVLAAVLSDRLLVFGVIVAVTAGLSGLRFAQLGVVEEPDGFKVVNFFRTLHLRWGEIDRFTCERAGPYPAQGFVYRKGHHVRMSITALGSAGVGPLAAPEKVRQQVERLNALVDSHGGHAMDAVSSELKPPNGRD